jgi:hypothetical protein
MPNSPNQTYKGRSLVLQQVSYLDLPNSLEPYTSIDISEEEPWFAVVATIQDDPREFDLIYGRGHSSNEAVENAMARAKRRIDN